MLRFTHRPDLQEYKTNPPVYEFGSDENIYYDDSLSFDPEKFTQDFTPQYECSQNVSVDFCSSLGSSSVITQSQLASINSTEFWIQVKLNHEFRNSTVLRITFRRVPQIISRCFEFSDPYS